MVPLPESKLENLIPLLHERHEELKEKRKLLHRDLFHHVLKECYAMRTIDCYVNDTEKPTHLLALMRVGEYWDEPPSLVVQAIYISKEARGDKKALETMVEVVHEYARFHRLSRIVAGTPCNDAGNPLSKIWDNAGFYKAHIMYSKDLP